MKGIRPRVADKAQYLDIAKATLPVAFLLSSSTMNSSSTTTAQKDESEHQAIRDIERDVIVVNGQLYRAGPGGWALIVDWLVDLMVSRVSKVWEGHGEASAGSSSAIRGTKRPATYVDFAKQCLKAVNR